MTRLGAVFVTLLLIVACGPADVAPTTEPGDTVVSSTTVSTLASIATIGPGLTTTTVTATSTPPTTRPPTTTSSSTLEPRVAPMMLASDGLAIVSFGDPVDEALSLLIERFGTPSTDDLYESPFDVPADWDSRGPDACHWATTGYVCFDYIRTVWWEDSGLWVLFSDISFDSELETDDPDYFIQVPPSFQGYSYKGSEEGSPLYTADGITVGSKAEDLLSLGPLVSFSWNPCGDNVDFSIRDREGDDEDRLLGNLDDQDFEAFDEAGVPNARARVRSLSAGQSGSC